MHYSSNYYQRCRHQRKTLSILATRVQLFQSSLAVSFVRSPIEGVADHMPHIALLVNCVEEVAHGTRGPNADVVAPVLLLPHRDRGGKFEIRRPRVHPGQIDLHSVLAKGVLVSRSVRVRESRVGELLVLQIHQFPVVFA